LGALSVAGGFAGSGDGTFINDSASGMVSAGHDSVLGAFTNSLRHQRRRRRPGRHRRPVHRRQQSDV